jgi:uncharacterized membrane protein
LLDLDKALTDIRAVKAQIARGTEFRGYGPVAFSATGVFAIVAAVAQGLWIERPVLNAIPYVGLWIGVALLSVIVIALEVVTRSRRIHSGLADEMIQQTVEQLLPALIGGALLTFVILRFAPREAWMLPGLWQIMLSLGVFASCRSLPAPFFSVGVWYLCAGLICIAFANGTSAYSPWAMGVPFGLGQLFAAALVHWVGIGDVEQD